MANPTMPNVPHRIYGIDFSASIQAGRRTWITAGAVAPSGLRISDCRPAELLPDSGRDRHTCLTALRSFLTTRTACAVGMDFPFGLPGALVEEPSWLEFVRAFPGRYPSPSVFKNSCVSASGGRELKRETDRQAKTPWSAYNLRLYRQTYFGINHLLRPLVQDNCVYVLPMQTALPDRLWVLEVCPASTLRRAELSDASYKGSTQRHASARAHILGWLDQNEVTIPLEVRSTTLADKGGDALDSLIAAYATFKAVVRGAHLRPVDRIFALEGYVYV